MKFRSKVPHDDNSKCKCDACKDGMDALIERQKEAMKKCGFYTHFVQDDDTMPFGVNMHTHGLDETYNHKDFQSVVPLNGDLVHSIFWHLVEELKKGTRFKAGDVLENYVGNGYKLKLVNAEEDGRAVLRIIFPDKNGNYEKETMEEPFLKQYDDLKVDPFLN